MKMNFYQKMFAIFYMLILLILTVFIVPHNEITYKHNKIDNGYENFSNSKIIYDFIWNGSKIDYTRLALETISLTVIFIILFFLFSKKENPDFQNKRVKKIIKREFLIFFIPFIVFNCCYFLFVWVNNSYYNNKLDKLNTEYNKLVDNKYFLLKNLNPKKNNRLKFYHEMLEKYPNIKKEFDNNIQNFWEYNISKCNDNEWINKRYSEVSENFKEEFNIKNKEGMKFFLFNNEFTEKDKELNNVIKINENNISKIETSIDNFEKRKIDYIMYYYQFFLLGLLIIIYFFRFIILYIVKFYRYLNN